MSDDNEAKDQLPANPLPVNPPVRNVQKPDSIIEHALSRLDPEQEKALAGKAAEEALRLEVERRKIEQEYVTGKKAIEDHIDAFGLLEKQGRLTRQSMSSDVKTGAGRMRIESKSGATCFVATAAFQDVDHAAVTFLRDFRDKQLASSRTGRAFIEWYWNNGPKLAAGVASSGLLRRVVRFALIALVAIIKLFALANCRR